MTSRQARVVGWVAALLFIFLAAYWFWSPALAMHSMHQAVIAGDADAFNSHVDYPRVRDSIKRQLSTIIATKMGDTGLASSFGNALGLALSGTVVDAMVRPATLMAAMQLGKLATPLSGANGQSSNVGTSPAAKGAEELPGNPNLQTRREGLNRFVIQITPRSSTRALTLVLERSGFADWKLTEVRLPIEN
jgi:Protein of unknown function (DUF2939)